MKPLFIIGEAYGEAEDRIKSPFVGASGMELLRQLHESGNIRLSSIDWDYINRFYKTSDPHMLESVWELHPEIKRTNVFNLRPARNDIEYLCGGKSDGIEGYPAFIKSKYILAKYESELDRLAQEILAIDPNLIVCLGNTPLWALAGRGAVTKIRGTTLLSTHTVSGYKLLPTYHPTAILRQYENRPTAIADFMKAKRENESPEIRRPPREIWIEPSLEDIRTFNEQFIRGCDLLSVDIETAGDRITCIGFAPSPSIAIVIPFDDERSKSRCYWASSSDEAAAWKIVRRILSDSSIPKLLQNGVYDIAFLWRAYGIKTINAIHDTMLLQHALQPEALKGLGYLGSIYSDEGSWKHMRKKHETVKKDN